MLFYNITWIKPWIFCLKEMCIGLKTSKVLNLRIIYSWYFKLVSWGFPFYFSREWMCVLAVVNEIVVLASKWLGE